MKVWILSHNSHPPSFGGFVRHYYFSKYEKSKGNDIKILTSSKIHNKEINMIEGNDLFKEIVVDGVEFTYIKNSDFKGNGVKRIYNFLEFSRNLKKTCNQLAKEELPDVIYASSPDIFTAYAAIKFAKKYKIPVVVEIRDFWPESIVAYAGYSRQNPIIKILYKLEKYIYKSADALIFTMQGCRDYLEDKKWDIGEKPIYYINNGVDIDKGKTNIEKFTVDDKDLHDEDFFKVIYVGAIRKANNLRTLIESAEHLRDEKIKFIIYGDGIEREEYINYCKEHGLDNVVFKGYVDIKYVPYILSKSDLNVINYKPGPIWKYGQSQNKLFEYLASGKPIISNINVGYDIVAENHCGVSREFEDSLDYSKTILSIKNMSKVEYELMCENAKRTAKDYDYKKIVKKIEDAMVNTARGEIYER